MAASFDLVVRAAVPEPPRVSQPRLPAQGGFQFSVSGRAGDAYDVESSSDLATWSRLFSVTNENGTVTVTDPAAPSAARRYYRLKGR